MVGLTYRNVCTICDAVNIDFVERDICAACTPSTPTLFDNVCMVCGTDWTSPVSLEICSSCDLSAKKSSAAATPQEKKASATPNLKLFKIKIYNAVSVTKSIILEVDKEAALTYAKLAPGDRAEVTEIVGPFKAGFVIHNGWI